jgi:hypothetical protein
VDGVTGAERGRAYPKRDSPPTLSHDSSSTIPRKLSGVTLDAVDAEWFRPLTDRVLLEVEVAGVTYQMGRYLCIDSVDVVRSGGIEKPLTLVDEMIIVDQPMETGFYAAGNPISVAAERLLADMRIAEPVFESGLYTSINSWSSGTSRASVWRDLATEGGYLPPWFDYLGRPRMIQAFDPATRIPDFDWDTNSVVVSNSVTRKSDLPDAPNRWVVVSNDTSSESNAKANPIVGRYDIPATAPHSIANRGFVVPMVVDMQVTNQVQADASARTLGVMASMTETITCDTRVDPRHGAYQVVKFLGELWFELSWSMSLDSVGMMGHTLTRAWPPLEDL